MLFCQREFQPDGRMTLYAIWNASYDQKLFEAMESFVVTLQLFDDQNIVVTETYKPEYIQPKVRNAYSVWSAFYVTVYRSMRQFMFIRQEISE